MPAVESKDIFFSVIIPCYNRARFVGSTIQSILNQVFDSVEIVLVDDGSQDNISEVIKPWLGHRVKYIHTENHERGAARNAGLKEAKGLYINYFDSDDVMNPCLKDVCDFLLKKNNPPVVFGAIENITADNKSLGYVSSPYSDFKKSIIHNNFLACGSVFVRSDVATAFAFSEDRALSGTEDWELWLRIYSTHDFTEYPGTIFKQRHHSLRSLNQFNVKQITQRESSFISHIENNKDLLRQRFSRFAINLLRADRYTLIALAQLESGDKKKGREFWVKSFGASLGVVVRKRFWAVARKIINS